MAKRIEQAFFAFSIEMIDRGNDCDDMEYLDETDPAEERQQWLLTAQVAVTCIKDDLTEAERKDDTDSHATHKQT